MPSRKIVYLNERPDFLDKNPDVTVVERYDFGDAGKAALIEFDTDRVTRALDADDRVEGWEDELVFETQDIAVGDIEIQESNRVSFSEQIPFHDIDPTDGNYGQNVTVGVMDSGIDPSKGVFDDAEIEYHDFTGSSSEPDDAVGHGTAVAGQIANIAPEVELISLRVFGDGARTGPQILLRAYEWVSNNSNKLDYVNISLGSDTQSDQFDALHERVFNQNEVGDVVAAGNSGGKGGSPATAKNAYSVGAMTIDGRMADFSSYNKGINPEVSAIGKNMVLVRASGTSMGTVIDENRVIASGTSFAAPTVAGLVAKLDSAGANAPREAFKMHAIDVGATDKDGAGKVIYERTRDGERPEPEPPSRSAKIWSFAGYDSIFIKADWFESGKYDAIKDGNTVEFVKRE